MDNIVDTDSSFYEYVALHRQKRIDTERLRRIAEEARREQIYESYYYNNVNKPSSLFNLPGFNVIDFTHRKIKFSFRPKSVVHLIRSKVIFYCSVRYVNGFWTVARNTLPANIQISVFSLFLESNVKIVKLKDLLLAILEIHRILVQWSRDYQDHRREKYERYLKNPEKVLLDSEDEELFLTEEQVEERRKHIAAILKRMLPPQHTQKRHQRVAGIEMAF